MNTKGTREWFARAMERTGGRGKALKFLFEPPNSENDIIFDLHIHDTNSDGKRTLQKVFNIAANTKRFEVLSVTNHDNIKSPAQYQKYQVDTGRYKGEFINGVEITCRLNGIPVECLVYDFNFNKANGMVQNLEFPFLNRNFKVKRILELIQERLRIVTALGIGPKFLNINDFVSLREIDENGEIKGDAKCIPVREFGIDAKRDLRINSEEMVERLAIDGKEYEVNFDNFNSKLFKYLVKAEKGREFLASYGIDIPEEFVKFTDVTNLSIPAQLKPYFDKFNRGIIQNKNSALGVDDSELWPTFEEACGFAKATGGVAVLAHPFGYSGLSVDPIQLIEMAVAAGADGIECFHGFNTAEQVEYIYNYCKEHGLLITAGSDTHDYYSYQGNRTEIGTAPGRGEVYGEEFKQIIEDALSVYNLHYYGTGEYKKEKNQIEK